VICLLLGYPVAYLIVRSRRWRTLLLFLVVLPFWTSFLVRTFAMIFLMRDTGLINNWLMKLGVIAQPMTLLYTPFAVMSGLVYGFLPFMILPIYASLEKLDHSLLEAAEVLGARPAARFRRVTLPLSMPGVVAGCLLVFIPALGSFLTADLLGGAKQVMIGNLVQNQFSSARNWPFGSAASFIVMALVLAAVMLYLRVKDRSPAGPPLR
jgi:spermidine/putrescine transport system permease protein